MIMCELTKTCWNCADYLPCKVEDMRHRPSATYNCCDEWKPKEGVFYMSLENEITEVKAEETVNKRELGRKFFVVIIWIVIAVIASVLVLLKRIDGPVYIQIIEYLFYISSFYIGGNVAQKIGRYVSGAFEKKFENKTEGEK